MTYDVIIVGGGLAGLTSAIHLSKKGLSVLLIEKNDYPKHKVCGEYISNEVLPYLDALGFNPFDFGAKKIDYFTLSTAKSKSISTKLPFGGFGISRYCMDWELAKLAIQNGAEILQEKVIDIQFENNQFTVFTHEDKQFSSEIVIGSFGKRSNLDIQMNREFIQKPTPFLGIKAHYKGDFPDDAVALHNFDGGYCGISKVETNLVNVCYLTDYKAFKKHKNIEDFQKNVLSKNSHLKEIFESFEMTFENPLTISQVSFSSKQPVENHVLMCGDSAGMIHPLAGNGMSMAIRAAQMASMKVLKFKSKEIESRAELEKQYTQIWNQEFSSRLKSGHIIARLFRLGLFSELIMVFLKAFPFILPHVIKSTHGKPMKPEL
ncbi:NAD(P)/FAD-dependent oxidoreductase [Bizionia argentinensis JUB59]|uniref:NAD(P)/FAD-dependent oxidoreductase n=1 Tax=Bizionia argentinensis JUB59 TaxID=1046627 RepID=G2EFD7_9FLAO|nr:FAD-dependent oxidoreductase [Bizionia argentinensis]EGV42886.1 NAD(P)/FAD-dependent oxidoreductase [Bizionia argentinensis JUB59]